MTVKNFQQQYDLLNKEQQRAVDNIDGPLLVLAGPGTGKTQLLAMRVAKILLTTDTAPQSILCLTFTESAQREMQQRLINIIGPSGYKVAVHTFHGFGNHILGTQSDFFAAYFDSRSADDLTNYQIISELLERLPRDNPLSLTGDGNFHYLKDIQSRISQSKQAGLSPEDLSGQIKTDLSWIKKSLPIAQKYLANIKRMAPKYTPCFIQLLGELKGIDWPQPQKPGLLPTIRDTMLDQLEAALAKADTKNVKALSAWRKDWFPNNAAGETHAASQKKLSKLTALAEIYSSYQQVLKQRRLYDYDDMILRVVEAMDNSPELKAELQEQFQYILVDEYQDTNGAQIRLLELLADNPVNENRPNLMAVGDDDQAIYGFQGAVTSNMMGFLDRWCQPSLVVLTVNYRSTQAILDAVREFIVQGEDRLEDKIETISKVLDSGRKPGGLNPRVDLFSSHIEQLCWIADQIKADLESGSNPSDIAVLAPKHKHLEALVPYLLDRDIPVAYEKREDVLRQQHIVELVTLARVVVHLSQGESQLADQYLPELLSYAWWEIPPGWLWEIALMAQQNKQGWTNSMLASKHNRLRKIIDWLLEMAKLAHITPLEPMLDKLIGPELTAQAFVSTYRQFYFKDPPNQDRSITYVRLLSSLVALRTALRRHLPDQQHSLVDLIAFVDLRLSAALPLKNDHPLVLEQNAVQVMTAYKAKGLEFDKVFVINANEHTWVKEKGHINKIALPPNYIIAPAQDSENGRLRLLYVAASRAKDSLVFTSYERDDEGVEVLPLEWLQSPKLEQKLKFIPAGQHIKPASTDIIRGLSFDWLMPHFELKSSARWRDLLSPTLESYALSPTHLTAYLNVTIGGPKTFLVRQLLRFPEALGVGAQFGNVMHHVMQRLHSYFNEQNKLPPIGIARKWLIEEIEGYYFGPIEEPKALRRGQQSLAAIYHQKRTMFAEGQRSEYSFSGEGVVVNGAKLKGNIDRLDLDFKTKYARIADYKTGKPIAKWPIQSTKVNKSNSYSLLKAHHYRQQLLFYKLLVENSRSFGGVYTAVSGSLEFLEADENDRLTNLEILYDDAEMDQLRRLISAVWPRIMSLDLPDTSHYSPNFDGVKQFEADLLDGKV